MNTYKKEDKKEEKGFLSHLLSYKFAFNWEDKLSMKYLPNVIFLCFLGILYIANTHYSNRLVQKISKLETEVKDLRDKSNNMKYHVTEISKYYEVKDRVKSLNLFENDKPVVKVD